MSEHQNQIFSEQQQAIDYVQQVRTLYRAEEGEYRGRRNPDQQLIAELTADEARLIVDGTMAGYLAMFGMGVPRDYEDVEKAGFSWSDFRNEFERLLVGFGVLTNRLNRDGKGVASYADLGEADRMQAASVLFGDFLKHNALRFGADPTGVRKTVREHTPDGGIKVSIVDLDKAGSERELERNMRERGYSTGVATHPAGKMSPDEYEDLRRQYPEMKKDNFDRDVGFYTNAEQEFAKRGQ